MAVMAGQIAGQSVRPADRAHRPLRKQHPGREPRRVRRWPIEKVHARGGVDGQQAPPETEHCHRRDRRYPSADRKPIGRPRQDRQRQIKTDLHRQAPHLSQPGGQCQRHVHLGQGQIGQPDGGTGAVGLGQQSQDHHNGEQVARHDANQPGPQIVSGSGPMTQSARGRRVTAPQQEARQREEHRDGQIESVQQTSHHTA